MKQFTITKKISKQGNSNVLIIPKSLQDKIKHKDLVEVNIKILEEN